MNWVYSGWCFGSFVRSNARKCWGRAVRQIFIIELRKEAGILILWTILCVRKSPDSLHAYSSYNSEYRALYPEWLNVNATVLILWCNLRWFSPIILTLFDLMLSSCLNIMPSIKISKGLECWLCHHIFLWIEFAYWCTEQEGWISLFYPKGEKWLVMIRREVYDIREKMRAVSVPFLYFFPSQTKSFPLVYTRLSLSLSLRGN